MKIVDTNILMSEGVLSRLLSDDNKVGVPIEVLEELDRLKTLDGQRGYLARTATRAIKENVNQLDFLFLEEEFEDLAVDDLIIEHCKVVDSATLVTNDLNLELKARAAEIPVQSEKAVEIELPDPVQRVNLSLDEFSGFLNGIVPLSLQSVPVGQFAHLRSAGEPLGTYRFLGDNKWDKLSMKDEISSYSFDVSPWDEYQACAIKSLQDDEFTIITGAAGTGKTLISLGYCMERISKTGAVVNIFINPVKTKDSKDLGYYPGTRNEKLLDNFIGGVLASKLGDMEEVYRLLSIGAIRIYPFSDIRGIEIGAGDIMYITEAQNLSVELLRLAIQRCASGSKLIVEGDYKTQVDSTSFEGINNGMRRAIEIFTGTEECDFGHVNLPIIYRSAMARVAEDM